MIITESMIVIEDKDGSFDQIVTNNSEASSEPPCKKARTTDIDTEDIIMGEELSDVHINTAQNLLKVQFPELGGLKSTLLQQKEMPVLEIKEKVVQIIHCSSRHHWIVATTIGGGGNCVVVYDSVFKTVDKETRKSVNKLFESISVKSIKIPKVQKQKGNKDCGLFAVAFATALAHGQNPSKQRFHQASLRSHFVACLEKGELTPFP